MSHFNVYVTGNDIDKALAPFSEELEVTPYKQYCEAGDLTSARECAEKEGKKFHTDIYLLSDYLEEKCDQDYKGIYYWCTYNPNSKWDWYQVGGRFKDSLLLTNRERFPGDLDSARKSYNAQPAVRAINKADLLWWSDDPSIHFAGTREEFCQRIGLKRIMPYAILHEGNWMSHGRMGWFGASFDEVDNWPQTAWDMLTTLPPETLITVVDCHI